jgi:hypothetical protein
VPGPDPEQRHGGEPERHDRAERPADPRRPLGLDGKQRHEVTRQATDGMRSRASGSQRTLCWSKVDSNSRSPVIGTMIFDTGSATSSSAQVEVFSNCILQICMGLLQVATRMSC